MIAVIIKTLSNIRDTGLDAWNFVDAVIQDMRQTRAQLEQQYGPLGF
jgi:hypothetical protein